MTATVVNVTNSTAITGTALTVAMPASPVVGNLLVVILGYYQTCTFGGLTAFVQQEVNTGPMSIAVYTRQVTGTEATSYTVTGFTDVDGPRVASVLQLANHAGYEVGETVYDVGAGVPWTMVNATTVNADDLIIRAAFNQNVTAGITWTWSGTTTARADVATTPRAATGYFGHLAVVTQTLATAGTTTATTITRSDQTSVSQYFGGVTMAIKPAGVTVGGQGSFFSHFMKSLGSGVLAPPPPPPPPTTDAVNRPTNPALILYGSTSGNASLWAHPGALIIAGRSQYNSTEVQTMAAGGATVIVYLDLVINNATGRYHDKLINASEFGPAVPLWPPGWVCNQYGSLNDFRVGGILQSKLRGVMELILSENPHVAGIFLDDLGTRSWFPSLDWNAFTDKEGYRNGAIAAAQTARSVADANDLFLMINGTWGANATAGIGDGGYPVRGQHGCSLVDGGYVENHATSEANYWGPYTASSAQWGEGTPRGIGYNLFHNLNNTTARDFWVNGNYAAFATTADYNNGPGTPFKSFTDFGMPNRTSAPTPPPPPTGTPLFNGDYSTNNYSQWQVVQNRVYNSNGAGYNGTFYGATIITDPTKNQKVSRFEVRLGDNPGFSPGTERSQVQAPESTTGGTEGTIRWYSFSVRFDPTFPQNHADLGWGVTNGWHPTSSTGSGPIQWATHWENGQWSFLANRQASPGEYLNTIQMYKVALGTAWHDMKIRVHFSASDTIGNVQLWRNGIRQTFLNGSQTYFVRTLVPGASSVYYKEGFYRQEMNPTAIVYCTNFRCATSEANLNVSF